MPSRLLGAVPLLTSATNSPSSARNRHIAAAMSRSEAKALASNIAKASKTLAKPVALELLNGVRHVIPSVQAMHPTAEDLVGSLVSAGRASECYQREAALNNFRSAVPVRSLEVWGQTSELMLQQSAKGVSAAIRSLYPELGIMTKMLPELSRLAERFAREQGELVADVSRGILIRRKQIKCNTPKQSELVTVIE